MIFIRYCKRCKKAFDYGEKKICNECLKKEEEDGRKRKC